MKTKLSLWIIIAMVGAVSLAGTSSFKKIKYSVKMVENKWLVVDDTNNRPVAIDANRKDDVEWTAVGSDVVFQFPVALSDLFTKEDGTSAGGNYTIRVAAGKKLKLKVKDNAPLGRYVYSVFVINGQTYAEGSSPPVIIIK